MAGFEVCGVTRCAADTACSIGDHIKVCNQQSCWRAVVPVEILYLLVKAQSCRQVLALEEAAGAWLSHLRTCVKAGYCLTGLRHFCFVIVQEEGSGARQLLLPAVSDHSSHSAAVVGGV